MRTRYTRLGQLLPGILTASLAVALMIAVPSTAQQTPNTGTATNQEAPRFKNLKVLPKNISPDDLRATMHTWSKSLGVRCTFCHVGEEPKTPGERPKFDFASDAKPEKLIARQMLTMTMAINKNYIGRMTGLEGAKLDLEHVTCATCHMGSSTPLVSVDSLPKSTR